MYWTCCMNGFMPSLLRGDGDFRNSNFPDPFVQFRVDLRKLRHPKNELVS